MGFFSGLDAEAYDRTYSDRELIRRIAGYFQVYRTRLLWISLSIMLISASWASIPILVSQSVDLLGSTDSIRWTYILAGLLMAVGVLIWLINWIRRRLTSRVVGDVMLKLRRDAFSAATQHDLSFYDEFSSGRIVSRITSDTKDFAQLVVLVTDLISQFLEALILFVVLIRIDLRLTLWTLALTPFVFALAISYRKLARRVTRRGFRAMANVNAAIKEAVTGIAIAKNFRQEATIYSEFDTVNQQSYRINVQRGLVLSLVFPTLNALGGAGTALLVYVGGMSAAQGIVTVGAWYLFITSLDRFWFPMLNLSAFWSQVQNGLSAAERVFALIDNQPTVIQTAERPVPRLKGEIEFDGLTFHYKPSEAVLETFNLHIHPGESIALVGHTGAGKSTIAKLVARFYEFQSGRLLIDGYDIRSFNLLQYRRQLGIVSQTPFLFSGTVEDNVRYGHPDLSQKEMMALVHRIGNGEWLETLPQGLQTEVGERGGKLSMGQRQLVSLMRVLVQRPAIFILDEATASIDPFTECQIQSALDLILSESTSILIAHRLSTVKAADRIIVLKQGKIIEGGDHSSLMKSGGHYAELYNTYFRHQSPDYRPTADGRGEELGFITVKQSSSE